MLQSLRYRGEAIMELSPHILWRKSILIVEDEPLIALGVHGALNAAGASILSASSVREATRLIGYAEISAAVVDVRLGSEDASTVCQLLARRNIPFVFYTGQPKSSPIFAEWPGVQVFRKPAPFQEIVFALARLLSIGVA
jgi:DNA-binding response OmpR family regulator